MGSIHLEIVKEEIAVDWFSAYTLELSGREGAELLEIIGSLPSDA